MAREDEGGLALRVLRDLSAALPGPTPLAERLDRAAAALVPALADRAEVRRGGSASSIAGGAPGLELPLRDSRSRTLGALHLVRRPDRPEFDRAARLLAEEAATRLATAIEIEELRSAVADTGSAHDEFLATLSHEIRTPLNVVVGWIELMRRGQLSPGKQERALELIDRNARVQARLIEDLLDASRMVAGTVQIDPGSISAAELVAEAVEALRPQAGEAGLTLVEQRNAEPIVRADRDRMSQILHNLIGNAVKFTPSGGRVEVAVAANKDAALIAVTDTGAGIAEDLLPLVFDRFVQGERKRLARSRGLGLGLFIARHLARLHGGDITAESRGPGRGSRFTLRLPLAGP